jgi:hypothetical protein
VSAIQEKIRQLQRQAAKIEVLRSIQNFVAGLNDPAEFPGLTKEVEALLNTFIDTAVTKIEAGENFGSTDRGGQVNLTSEELSVIRRLLPALQTGPAPEVTAPTASRRPVAPAEFSREDAAAFAIQYREFGGRKVKGFTDDGHAVEGPVIKINAPFLMVRNDLAEGELTPVRPENIK